MEASRVNVSRVLPARFVPTSGFPDDPLAGLLPARPNRFCFTPTAPLGASRIGAFPSQKVASVITPPTEPTCRFSHHESHGRNHGTVRRAAAPGLCPFRESLAVERVFSTPSVGGSSGFSLLGYSGKRLDSDFAESPLIRFSVRIRRTEPPAIQSLDQRQPDFFCVAGKPAAGRKSNPCRVLAPVPSQIIRTSIRPGYGFTLCRAVHCCRPPDTLWTNCPVLPELIGTA